MLVMCSTQEKIDSKKKRKKIVRRKQLIYLINENHEVKQDQFTYEKDIHKYKDDDNQEKPF